MKSYRQVVEEHLRLTILRILSEDPDYTMNDSLLADLVVDYGFAPSRDKMRSSLSWLREQGLVEYTDDALIIATLTVRGLDVACGKTVVPGVKRPSPGRCRSLR